MGMSELVIGINGFLWVLVLMYFRGMVSKLENINNFVNTVTTKQAVTDEKMETKKKEIESLVKDVARIDLELKGIRDHYHDLVGKLNTVMLKLQLKKGE